MSIMLSSKKCEIVGIKKETNAKLFKDLQVGDVIEFRIPLKTISENGMKYSPIITVENLSNGEKVEGSFHQLPRRLEMFEIAEISN